MKITLNLPDGLNRSQQFAAIRVAAMAVDHWQNCDNWSQGAISTYGEIATSTKRIRGGYSVRVWFEEDEPDAA